jgi:hypothetical protein
LPENAGKNIVDVNDKEPDMLRTIYGGPRNNPPGNGPKRFVRLSAQESSTAELLAGCAIVTASGERIGHVDHLMIDAVTHQLRYVILSRRRSGAVVALPWQGLYFDAANARLVFYTLV